MLLDTCKQCQRGVEWRAVRCSREEVRAASDVVMDKAFVGLLLTEIFNRVRPENVAHETLSGRLTEAINLNESML